MTNDELIQLIESTAPFMRAIAAANDELIRHLNNIDSFVGLLPVSKASVEIATSSSKLRSLLQEKQQAERSEQAAPQPTQDRAPSLPASTHQDSDGTGYCRGCGTTIGEAHHSDCSLDARPNTSGDENRLAQWLVRALVRLAIRNLADANKTSGDDWPAGQEWHELGHTSQHAFMRRATAEAGIPHEEYREFIEVVSHRAGLGEVWNELEEENKKLLAAAPQPPKETK